MALSGTGHDADLWLAQKVERWLRGASGRFLALHQGGVLNRRDLTTYVRGLRARGGSLDRVLKLLCDQRDGRAAPLWVSGRDGRNRIAKVVVHPELLQGPAD